MDHFCYLYFEFAMLFVCSLQPCGHCWERADLLVLLNCMRCFIMILSLSMWCSGSDMVLDFIDFLIFPSFLL